MTYQWPLYQQSYSNSRTDKPLEKFEYSAYEDKTLCYNMSKVIYFHAKEA